MLLLFYVHFYVYIAIMEYSKKYHPVGNNDEDNVYLITL